MSSIPTIFLDLDGVLNSTRSLLLASKASPTIPEIDFLFELSNTYYSGYPVSTLTTDLLGLDPTCVKALNLVIEATGSQVVVSSSWRFCHNIVGLQKLLEYRGFIGELVDVTPINLAGSEKLRGQEIQAWLDLNPEVDRFVIIDDDSDMADLSRYLVKVNKKVGLTETNALEAISIVKPDSVRV
jgi:hypothetical protein